MRNASNLVRVGLAAWWICVGCSSSESEPCADATCAPIAQSPSEMPGDGAPSQTPAGAPGGGAPSGMASNQPGDPSAVEPGAAGAPAMMPPPAPTIGGPTKLPTAKEPCPTMKDGDVTFLGKKVRIWMAPDAKTRGDGPLIFYWHGTTSNPGFEAPAGLGTGLQATVDQGGVVAGFYTAACAGCRTTGNNVWYYEDFDLADEVLACAIEQAGIDTRRIHSAGMSAGGLQSTAMLYARSNYLAAVASYSGGVIPFVTNLMSQDPSNKVAAMIVYGGPSDMLGLRYEDTSNAFKADLEAKGSFAFLCNHGMGHRIPPGIGASTFQFFTDHPYGTTPSPYAGRLPASFPAYCAL